MDTLRIKCPSCGIILEVKNSKNEAVKRITCPNCKKQLAVNFADVPTPKPSAPPQPIAPLYEGETRIQLSEGVNRLPHIPAGVAELRVTRLADGSCKHILRALVPNVKLNSQTLQPDDEVVLQRGDRLEIEGKVFSFDKAILIPKPQEPNHPQEPSPKPQPKTKASWPWPIIAAAVLLALLAVWHFYPTHPPKKEVLVITDTVVKRPSDTIPVTKPAKPKKKEAEQPAVKQTNLASMDLYSLELLANKNDANAQYELGKRLVHTSGSKNIIMGINWLKKASRSGSSQAYQTLNKALHSLQTKASQGDSVAIYILHSIDHS